MRSHKVTAGPMALFDPNSTSKLRSAMHFRYSIAIKTGLGIPSLYLYVPSAFAKLLFFILQNTYMFLSIECN